MLGSISFPFTNIIDPDTKTMKNPEAIKQGKHTSTYWGLPGLDPHTEQEKSPAPHIILLIMKRLLLLSGFKVTYYTLS